MPQPKRLEVFVIIHAPDVINLYEFSLMGRLRRFRDHCRDPTSVRNQVQYDKCYKYPASKIVKFPPHMFPFHHSIPCNSANYKTYKGQGIDPKVDANPRNSRSHS